MKLEYGKRYIMRNGEVTGKLVPAAKSLGHSEKWAFSEEKNYYQTWTVEGAAVPWDKQYPLDIMVEYTEPTPYQSQSVQNVTPQTAIQFDKEGTYIFLPYEHSAEALESVIRFLKSLR